MPGGCHVHPLKPAGFRCDGCDRLLCEDCVQEGHRLLLCALCGERALALTAAGPATVEQRQGVRRQRSALAYEWTDILRYCFRGDGAWIFWIAVAMFCLLQFFLVAAMISPPIQQFLPIAMTLLMVVLVMWIVPPQLASIVRATVAGRDLIPDWAPAHDYWERQREIVALLLATLAGSLPSVLVLRSLGCAAAARSRLDIGPECFVAMALTLPLGLGLGALGFGAFAAFDRFSLTVRWDLHARLMWALGRPAVSTLAALFAGVILALGLGRLLGIVPLAGGVVRATLLVYVLFTGAHAIGALFRRAPSLIERIYG
jgi:hypothetical protein